MFKYDKYITNSLIITKYINKTYQHDDTDDTTGLAIYGLLPIKADDTTGLTLYGLLPITAGKRKH